MCCTKTTIESENVRVSIFRELYEKLMNIFNEIHALHKDNVVSIKRS